MILIWRDLVKKDVKKETFFDVKCSLTLKEELDSKVREYYKILHFLSEDNITV